MKRSPNFKSQQGAALAISLIMLTVVTLVTLAGMRGGNMQERMTSNLNNKAISFMAAEAGASRFWQWMNDPAFEWESDDWQDVIPTDTSEANNIGAYGYFWIDPSEDGVKWSSDGNSVTVFVQGLSRVGGEELGSTRLRFEYSRQINPAFFKGLLSDEDIDINGNADLYSSAHANGDADVSGGSSQLFPPGTISAVGTASMKKVKDESRVISGAAKIEVPSALSFIDEYISDASKTYTAGCTIGAGDHKGSVYYCNGDVTTSGNFSNVTILARGNVTHNGASNLGSGALTVAIIASRNITLNGSSDTYGVFWADGNVTQNGSSVLGGSVVAGGDITFNGNFTYRKNDNFGDLGLPRTAKISSWTEHMP